MWVWEYVHKYALHKKTIRSIYPQRYYLSSKTYTYTVNVLLSSGAYVIYLRV